MQKCRLCHHPTREFLDLGHVPLPEEFRTKTERTDPIQTYPLGLSYCSTCLHVQLTDPVGPDPIYKKHYFYDYSVTATGSAHWQKLANILTKNLTKKDLVVDIGSNTGVLLSFVKKMGSRVLGVDPAGKLAKIARTNGISTICDYFTPAVARSIVKKYGHATVITCTNVFDHVSDLSEITKAFRLLLSPKGKIMIEVPYFHQMITKLTHIVYHQQIDYMMLTQLAVFFQTHGMTIVDAQQIPLHGGSIRIFVQHKGKKSQRLKKILENEQIILRHYRQHLAQFAKKVLLRRSQLKSLVQKLKHQNKIIAAVGASAKGITLLQYCNLTHADIEFITEKSPLKIGRFTPTGIPVVADRTLFTRQPDYAILLAWNFQKEIMDNLREFKGKWIIPVP